MVVLTEDEAAELHEMAEGQGRVADIFASRLVRTSVEARCDWQASWDVHLVVAPLGKPSPGSIGLALIIVPAEQPAVNEVSITFDGRLLIARTVRQGPSSFRGAIFDATSRSGDLYFDLLDDMSERLWSVGGETARRLLMAPLTPAEFEDVVPAPVLSVHPSIVGLEGFAPLPANTFAGLIQRNQRPGNGETRLARLLSEDANARVAQLSEQLERWQSEFHLERSDFRKAMDLEDPL